MAKWFIVNRSALQALNFLWVEFYDGEYRRFQETFADSIIAPLVIRSKLAYVDKDGFNIFVLFFVVVLATIGLVVGDQVLEHDRPEEALGVTVVVAILGEEQRRHAIAAGGDGKEILHGCRLPVPDAKMASARAEGSQD